MRAHLQADPVQRLLAFKEENNLNQVAFAKTLGVSQTAASLVLNRKRPASGRFQIAAERATAKWKGGQVRAIDWPSVPRKRVKRRGAGRKPSEAA